MTDAKGIPLAIRISAGNLHDIQEAIPTVESIRVPQKRGAPKTRPKLLIADKGYDARSFRYYLHNRNIPHVIPKREYKGKRPRKGRPVNFSYHIYKKRWVVERIFSFFNNFRRLAVRYDYLKSVYLGFLQVAAIVICLRHF